MLDILKTGNISLQDQSDKYEYLKQYFEVKSKIAKIQNILLVREILNRKDNKNKGNEQRFYADNEQKIQKQQEELELVINANYLAFQNSIQEYKQLKKEIDDIKSQLKNTTNNDAINENNINNNTYDINEDDIITKLKDIESKISTNKFEQKESTLKNNNNQFWEDVDKKTLEIRKHLLTKQLELCMLKDCIRKQINNFTDIFFYIEKDRQLNEFEIEKKNIKDSINSVGLEYLSKMNNLINNDEYLNEDFATEKKNMDEKIVDINNNIDNDNAKPRTTSTETSCIDSLCCRICAEEPITYTSKNINSRENIGNILTKFKQSESITISNIDGKNDFNKNFSNNKKNNNSFDKSNSYNNNYENNSLNNYQQKENSNINNNDIDEKQGMKENIYF